MRTIKELQEELKNNPSPQFLEELAQDTRAGVKKLLEKYARDKEKAQLEKERFQHMLEEERHFWKAGMELIAGCDEAGRGPLAGPLVVAAVILPKDIFIAGLNDSKQVSAKKRDNLYAEVMEKALGITVNIISPATIDDLNIYAATKAGMLKCLTGFKNMPEVALVDAMPLEIPFVHCKSIIHGDAKSASIAAASIIAKVTRDRLLVEIDKEYPQYGFAQHKGYGSEMHIEAINKYKPCSWHRRSYEPIKSMNVNNCLGPSQREDKFLVLK